MKFFIPFLLLAAVSCSTVPSDSREPAALKKSRNAMKGTPPAVPNSTPVADRYPPAKIAPKQNLTYENFRELLLANKIPNIEQALTLLGSRYPDYLRFHTLMYGSFSIQQSTFDEPRALVFGPEARFVFSFNGNPDQMGGMSFETLEYSDETHSFNFREIAFKKYPFFNMDELDLEPSEIAYQDDNVVISTPNPGKCIRCHGVNASPVWQTYFMWPGAYGSDDDQIFMSFDKSARNANNEGFYKYYKKPSSQGREIGIKPGAHDLELEGLARYAAKKRKHPRYQFLPWTPLENSVLNYSKGVPWAKTDYSKEAKAEYEKYGHPNEWPSRPNSYLLTRFYRLNMNRILARLEQAGLKNAYSELDWGSIYAEQKLPPAELIPETAKRLYAVISKYNFKKKPPTVEFIEEQLRKNIKEEREMQRERIYRQADNLGHDALEPQAFISYFKGKFSFQPHKVSKDSEYFYQMLLNLRQITDFDRIAMSMETDNQVLLTAVAILLADSGIDLHDYTLSLRQTALSFHTFGFDSAFDYLGVK